MNICLHLCVFIACMPAASRGRMRISDPLVPEVQMVMSDPCECWERNLSPLQEQQLLLTAESSFQLLRFPFLKGKLILRWVRKVWDMRNDLQPRHYIFSCIHMIMWPKHVYNCSCWAFTMTYQMAFYNWATIRHFITGTIYNGLKSM